MAKNLVFPHGYSSSLSQKDTQRAIKIIKDTFQVKLAEALNLDRVTAPLMVTKASGINDDLNGVERKVHFTMKEIDGTAEVVQSLAKWKRMALHRYGYTEGEGIYTDMNAIRRDDDCDNTHSLFVDQWDWEKVITKEQRTVEYLQATVSAIIKALAETNAILQEKYPVLTTKINEDVFFITSQELEDMYPDKSGKERENLITKEHGTVFIMGIGARLKSGHRHDGRAPDYDDWSLNGDILVWDKELNAALEISSMGIRVDSDSLKKQLEIANATERSSFPYHQGVLSGTLPLTIGGGLGQSRICMLLLGKAHVGEVQVSIWPDDMREECAENGIILL
ncbi:MAG: aspartate--ammonia ligase [Clostridia bacterium]|nr:aspartate--ammonia ligase [Clostridia bacterium]